MTTPVSPSPRESSAARSEATHAAARAAATSPGRERWERALQRYLQISLRQSTRTGPTTPAAPAAGKPAEPAEGGESSGRLSPLQSLIRAFSSIDLGGIFPRRQPPRGRS